MSRPICAKARAALGAAEDPLGQLRASGYVDRAAEQRASEHHAVKG